MTVEFEGRRYAVLLGSDVRNDGMYLEMSEVTNSAPDVVLLAFHSEADGRMTFSAYREDLPFSAVEWFLSEAKRRLRRA